MHVVRTLAALSVATLAAACASPGYMNATPAAAGMAPLTLGLLVATAWVLTEPVRLQVGAWALIAITVVVMVRTRVSPMWVVALGALVGALGYA